MQPLAARKLDEAFEIERSEPIMHVARGGNDDGPRHAVAGIEVEHDAVAEVELINQRAADMDFEDAGLHRRKGRPLRSSIAMI